MFLPTCTARTVRYASALYRRAISTSPLPTRLKGLASLGRWVDALEDSNDDASAKRMRTARG
jgi:hypothetical protein